MIYISCFTISLLCVFVANHTPSSLLRKVLWALAILCPSILAGLRDSGIGTDTQIYADSVWEDICSTRDLTHFFVRNTNDYYQASDWGYLFLNYCVSFISNDIHVIYFAVSLFIMCFVTLFAIRSKHNASIWLILFLFFFCFYNNSLNIMRQSMAMSCSLFGYKYLEEQHWIKAVIIFGLMISFHATSVVCLIIAGGMMIDKIKNGKLKKAIVVVTLSLFFVALKYFNEILLFVITHGIIPQHYEMYAATEDGVFQTSLLIMYSIFGLCFIVSLLLIKDKKTKSEILYYLVFHIFAILLSLLSIISYDAYRISLFGLFISILIFLPRTLCIVRRHNKNIYKILTLVIVAISVATWFYTIVMRGDTETFPYKSSIIDCLLFE